MDIKAELKQVQKLKEYLNKTQPFHKTLFYNNPDVSIITDLKGNIIDVNSKMYELLGYCEKELLEKSLFGLIYKDNINIAIDHFNKSINGNINEVRYKVLNRVNEVKNVKITFIPILDLDTPLGIYIIMKDITEEIRLEEAINYVYNHDQLTGIYNLKAFENILKEQIVVSKALNKTFMLILLDINKFKFLNDSLGYRFGDEILKEFANRIKKHIENKGEIARLGGDKFLILLRDVGDIDETSFDLQDINEILKNNFNINGREIYISVSIGVCFYPEHGINVNSLIQNADLALRSVNKNSINNYEVYNSKLDSEVNRKFFLVNDLKNAVEKKQFKLEYQPKVDARSNKIISGEVFIRWEHNTMGKLLPSEFLSLAEEIGIMGTIDEWIIKEVSSQIRVWKDEGLAIVPISINFSPKQLLNSKLSKIIKDNLEKNDINGRYLELEITGNAIDTEMLNVISEIKELGLTIAIDNFGEAKSSLANLNSFKYDVLKLSPELIKSIPQNAENIEIVAALIRLGHKLNMNIVASGVENFQQLNNLINMNCEFVQGYLFSKALSVNEFSKLLKIGVCYPKEKECKDDLDYINRREFFRIELKTAMGADMSIFKIAGKKVLLGCTEVMVLDIGPGGLKFLSDIKLPSRADLILIFETEILQEELQLYGKIVWSNYCGNDLYEYGLQFILDEKERETLMQLLNQLYINLRKHRGIDNYRLVKRVYIKKVK